MPLRAPARPAKPGPHSTRSGSPPCSASYSLRPNGSGFHALESDDDESAGVGDYLTWITQDLPDEVDDGTFAAVGLALGVLRSHPDVTAHAGNHGIHQAIADADRLRSDYAALTPTRGTDPA